MATSTCLYVVSEESWYIKNAVNLSAILLFANKRLLCEYGIGVFRSPNAIQHDNGLAPLTPERTDMLSGLPYRNIQPHHRLWVRKWSCFQYPHGQRHNVCSSTDCLHMLCIMIVHRTVLWFYIIVHVFY